MANGTASLKWDIGRLAQQLDRSAGNTSKTLASIQADPAMTLKLAGLTPDQWQQTLLRSSARRTLLLCSRQAGKSTAAAALALNVAWLEAPALVLLLSPGQRQSGELFRKVVETNNDAGCPVGVLAESATRLEFVNGSRIVALPGTEQTTRGYSGAALLVIDEAARVSDELYRAVRPMLAVSGGALIALSSAWAKLGWFYNSWFGAEDWNRVRVPANECPRISPAFLAEERIALGERWYRMEYFCEFGEQVEGLFSPEDIEAALAAGRDMAPLFGGTA